MSPEKFEKQIPVDKTIERSEEGISHAVEKKKIREPEEQAPASISIPQTEEQQIVPDIGEELVIIKNILAEDVAPLYKQLSRARQQIFRKRGEEIALRIKKILTGTRVHANEIFELIKNWLKMLPRISIYFLEQEAKIKTDKVLEMKREGQIIEK